MLGNLIKLQRKVHEVESNKYFHMTLRRRPDSPVVFDQTKQRMKLRQDNASTSRRPTFEKMLLFFKKEISKN